MSTADTFAASFTALGDRMTARRRGLGTPQMRIVGPGLHADYGDQDTPFHAASIGKLFTGVVVLALAAEREVTLDSRVDEVLPSRMVKGLVYPGATPPSILQLLRHEGGVPDYYEDEGWRRNGLVRVIAADPQRVWTPDALLDATRERKRPKTRPGERFLYSDTGYVLLGKIIEAVTGKTYHRVVTERIIEPLNLKRTFLPRLTTPIEGEATLAPCYLGTRDLSLTHALSCGWAGGGVASTPGDLVRFSQALHGGELLAQPEYRVMTDIQHRVRPGIHYGAALMQLRFEGFSPLLRGYARPIGHLGSLGTYLFYSQEHGTHLAMNFHSRREISRSIRAAIAIEGMLRKRSPAVPVLK